MNLYFLLEGGPSQPTCPPQGLLHRTMSTNGTEATANTQATGEEPVQQVTEGRDPWGEAPHTRVAGSCWQHGGGWATDLFLRLRVSHHTDPGQVGAGTERGIPKALGEIWCPLGNRHRPPTPTAVPSAGAWRVILGNQPAFPPPFTASEQLCNNPTNMSFAYDK